MAQAVILSIDQGTTNSKAVLVASDIDDRIVGIDPETYRQIPRRVGLAGGASKHRAIRAAIAGGWVNVIITDLDTARTLLGLESEEQP